MLREGERVSVRSVWRLELAEARFVCFREAADEGQIWRLVGARAFDWTQNDSVLQFRV